MLRLSALSYAAMLAVTALAAPGCEMPGADATAPEAELGTLGIPLTATGADGTLYRLVGEEFQLTGPQGTTTLADLPDEPVVSVDLPVGLYSVLLAGPYALEAWRDGAWQPVAAELISENPVDGVEVSAEAAAEVVFRFRTSGGVVELSPGRLDIRIEVEEGGPAAAPDCDAPGLTVTYAGDALPAAIAGHYTEAFDCARAEGGAWFGGVDAAHCFRQDGGSSWRVWNTGCGWEFGRLEPLPWDPTRMQWARHARTYSGMCADIPAAQLGVEALTAETFFDQFGEPIVGLASAYCAAP